MKKEIKHITLEKSAWDTEQLGISCGIIDCSAYFSEVDQYILSRQIEELIKSNNDISYITIKLHCSYKDIMNRLIKDSADFIDTELIYRCNRMHQKKSDSNIHFFNTYMPEVFFPLSEEMKWSRLFLDNRIPRKKAQLLWTESIRNHCSGRSDMLAIAFCEDKPAGIVTINFENNKTIKLFIVGVLPDFQRKGIGTELMRAVVDKYGEEYDIVVETSIRNIGAQRLYQKNGFELHHMRYILHLIR